MGQCYNSEIPKVTISRKEKLPEMKHIDTVFIVAKLPETKESLTHWTGFNYILEHKNVPNIT